MASQQAITKAEPGGEFVVVPGRAHGGGHHVAVELNGHRLFHDQFIGMATCPVGIDGGDEHSVASASQGHAGTVPAAMHVQALGWHRPSRSEP